MACKCTTPLAHSLWVTYLAGKDLNNNHLDEAHAGNRLAKASEAQAQPTKSLPQVSKQQLADTELCSSIRHEHQEQLGGLQVETSAWSEASCP